MSAHTTRLANSKRAMDIYNARNAYYKLLKARPGIKNSINRVTFCTSNSYSGFFDLWCNEGLVYFLPREKRVHVSLKE